MTLICFPHVAGFSMFYAFLGKFSYKNVDKVLLFDYPRKNFSLEGEINFKQYTNSAIEFIKANVAQDEPYILFGHSMGAFVACEAGLAMQNSYGKAPAGVIVSGQNPPYSVTLGILKKMPTDLIGFAEKLGGIPPKFHENPTMLKRIYDIAEMDLKAISTYQPTLPDNDKRLKLGMLMSGEDDFIIDATHHAHWDKTFCSIHSDNVFTGDHFYFNNHQEEVGALVDKFAGEAIKA